MPTAVALLQCTGVLGWGWPRSANVCWNIILVWQLWKSAPSSASAANATMNRSILKLVWNAPFNFIGSPFFGFQPMKKCRQVRLCATFLERYDASEWIFLGWEIHLEIRGIPQLIWFRTFWTPEFSLEFYFSYRKMCSRQFWACFLWFGILSHHRFFRFHKLEYIPAISIFWPAIKISSRISQQVHLKIHNPVDVGIIPSQGIQLTNS